MQEQHPYNMSPDQGWSRMATILDKEMPSRISRRPVLFWWTAAAVVTVAFSSLFLLTGKQPLSEQPILTQATEENTYPIKQQSDNNEEQRSNSSFGNPVASEHNNQIKTIDGGLQEKSINKENIEKPHKKSNDHLSATKNNPSTENNLFTLVESEKSVPVELNAINVNLNQEEALVTTGIIEERNVSSIDFLPLTEIDELEFNMHSIGSIEPGEYRIYKRDRSWISPYVSAGMMVGFNNGLGGDLGVGTAINFTSRLSMTAGLSYHSFTPDISILGSARDLALNAESAEILRIDTTIFADSGTYLDAAAIANSSSNKVIKPFIRSINQWQVNTGVKYKITPRFFIEGGVALGFSANAKSEYPIVEAGFTAAADPYIRNSFGNTIIRSFSKSFYGGLGFRLGTHLDLYARYTHGIDPYLLTNQLSSGSVSNDSDYIRGLNVGVRHNL